MVGFGGHHLAASNSWTELDQMALESLKRVASYVDLLQRLCRSLPGRFIIYALAILLATVAWHGGWRWHRKGKKDLTEGVLFYQWVLLIDYLALGDQFQG